MLRVVRAFSFVAYTFGRFSGNVTPDLLLMLFFILHGCTLEGCRSCGYYGGFNDNIARARSEKVGLRLGSPYGCDCGGVRNCRPVEIPRIFFSREGSPIKLAWRKLWAG